METACECYQMAEQCERQAADVKSARAREILIEVAALWRKLGDDLSIAERAAPIPSAANG